MEEDLKDWNYKVYPKKLLIPFKKDIDINYVEKSISNFGFIVLKWAIVKVENNNFVVNAVVIDKEE